MSKLYRQRNLFREACKLVVQVSCTDAYCKALAQVGLGLHNSKQIREQAFLLLINLAGQVPFDPATRDLEFQQMKVARVYLKRSII